MGHEPPERVEVSRTTEGVNIGAGEEITGFTTKAMKAETHQRTPGLSWKPEAENHAGGAEPSETTCKRKANGSFKSVPRTC